MDPTIDHRIDDILDNAVDHTGVVRGLVDLLAEVVPSVGALHYRYAPAGLGGVGGSLDGLMEDVGFRLVADPDADPCHLAASHQPPRPRVVHATRLVGREAFHGSRAYREFYRPHDFEHIVCVWLTRRGYGAPGFTGVVIPRAEAHGDFGPAELAAIEHVLPTLVAATHAELDAAQPLPHPAPTEAVIGFDSGGAVTSVSDAASAILCREEMSAEDVLGAVLDRIARSPLWSDARLDVRARSLIWSRRRLLLPHPTRRDAREVCVRLAPDGATGEIDLDPPGASVTARALDELGLTTAEACVLQALADGLQTAQIAQLLFISPATVRTHVKRLLKKLGLTSRVQAALVMQRLRLDEPRDRWR